MTDYPYETEREQEASDTERRDIRASRLILSKPDVIRRVCDNHNLMEVLTGGVCPRCKRRSFFDTEFSDDYE